MPRRLLLALALAAASCPGPSDALAQRRSVDVSGRTATLFGARRLEPEAFVLGLTTGFPKTGLNLHFGLAEAFDLAVLLGVTYGRTDFDGDRQGVGFEGRVPFRWTLSAREALALGLRLTPYFMVGECCPSIATGGDLAFLVDIALRRVLKLILGPELRTGFATVGGDPTRRAGYDGGLWANFGVETLIDDLFFVGLVFHGGVLWGTGPNDVEGVFRARINAGLRLD
ncbi:MAG: hypothetical protein ACFCGT_04715 [Sandaracinaceae bacterium]